MASSMINGERKYATPRRSGMTVLGKVAVPKPINLPSLRLENHGLDPNIEIVPKGTLSWGARPSSGSNAWSSSVLSPKADDNNVTPIHLSGRPSSSGGARPSTSGSGKSHDSFPNAWGSSLRPSSASGSLTSGHSSLASLRPRSAETRPASSQLSRFAEPLAENLKPWGVAGSVEKLEVHGSVNDGFSVSSEDFPTLGSGKESYTNNESLDQGSHGCPQSSSGKPSVTERFGSSSSDVSKNADVMGNGIDSHRKESTQDEGPQPIMERWHGDPNPYPNANIPPHHYESWHGVPGVNPMGGVWPRGPPAAPFGAPVPPGGFHMEPFYFHPQVSPPVLPNPHTVSPQGPDPRWPHMKNGDLFRPSMGDSYIRPGMPIRPGFYPGPVVYEGFYGPPMHFCNPNEQDFHFMGMPSGPPVYNMYQNPNAADSGNPYANSAGRRAPEQVDSGSHNSQGNHKALGRQDNGLDQNGVEDKWGNNVMPSAASSEQRHLAPSTLQESGSGDKGDLIINRQRISGEEASSETFESIAGHASMVTSNMTPTIDNAVAPKDRVLIQKIEGLNAKARASDGRHDPPSCFHREEPHSRVHAVNSMAGWNMNETGVGPVYLERHPTGILVPVLHDVNTSMRAKNAEAAVSRRSPHGVQNQGSRVKDRIRNLDAGNKNASSQTPKFLIMDSGAAAVAEVQEHPIASHSIKPNIGERDDAAISGFDPCGSQQAKMREIAKQPAIQLQKEEERTREQKANALAKPEELNRHSGYQVKDSSSQKVESAKQEVPGKQVGLHLNSNLCEPSSSGSCNTVEHTNGIDSKALKSPISSLSFGTVMLDIVHENLNLAAHDASSKSTASQRTASQEREPSRPKRLGNKQKRNAALENTSAEKSILDTSADLPKCSTTDLDASEQVAVNEVASDSRLEVSVEEQLIADSSPSLKKGNNRSAKIKHKAEESSSAFPPPSQKESDLPENVALVPADSKLDPPSIQLSSNPGDGTSLTKNVTPDSHGKVDHSSTQHPRRTHRNAQIIRTEKSLGNGSVVWAPVRLQSKSEGIEDGSQKPTEVSVPTTKNDHLMQSNSKSKRMGMERYAPKPVAKELVQQESIQQSFSLPTDPMNEDGTNRKVGAMTSTTESSGRPVRAADSININTTKARQTKVQGSWRQRGNAGSAPVLVSQDALSSTPNVNNSAKMPNEPEQTLKLDTCSSEGQPSKHEDWLVKQQYLITDEVNHVDGWIIHEEPIRNSKGKAPGSGELETMGKCKQNSYRGYKGRGNSHMSGHINADGDDAYDSLVADAHQPERPTSSKENRAVMDRGMPHWKPKSQAYVANNNQGNKSCGGEAINSDVVLTLKSETSYVGDVEYPRAQDLDVNLSATLHERREEIRGHRKSGRAKGDPFHSDRHGAAGQFEPAPAGTKDGHDQQHFSGFRRNGSGNGNSNRHSNQVQESHVEWGSSVQDTKQHSVCGIRNRVRQQNPQHEYQPIEPYNNDKSRNFEGQVDNVHAGPRFRERGQGHSRRGGGNFYRWQRGDAQLDGSYE